MRRCRDELTESLNAHDRREARLALIQEIAEDIADSLTVAAVDEDTIRDILYDHPADYQLEDADRALVVELVLERSVSMP